MADAPVTHNELQQMLAIAETNAKHNESIATSLKFLAESNARIEKVIDRAGLIIGIVSLAVIIVTSIVTIIGRGIDNRNIFKDGIKNVISEYDRERGYKSSSPQHHEVP